MCFLFYPTEVKEVDDCSISITAIGRSLKTLSGSWIATVVSSSECVSCYYLIILPSVKRAATIWDICGPHGSRWRLWISSISKREVLIRGETRRNDNADLVLWIRTLYERGHRLFWVTVLYSAESLEWPPSVFVFSFKIATYGKLSPAQVCASSQGFSTYESIPGEKQTPEPDTLRVSRHLGYNLWNTDLPNSLGTFESSRFNFLFRILLFGYSIVCQEGLEAELVGKCGILRIYPLPNSIDKVNG